MQVLFVDACVRDNSRTRRLGKKYLEKHFTDSDALQKVRLSALSLHALSAADIKKRDHAISTGNTADYALAHDFANADKIVIAAPYWDCFCPAILKVYFENICVNSVTFGYPDGTPTGFCKADELVYITTAGGYIADDCSLLLYLKEMCGMFGIEKLTFLKAEGLDILGNDPEQILLDAEKFETASAALIINPGCLH